MNPQWIRGSTSRQAHVGLPAGTVEDEHGRGGFSGPASHLYRLHAPTDWLKVEGPAAHRAYRLAGTAPVEGGRWPTWVLENAEVRIGWQALAAAPPSVLLRNADGDTLYAVHSGEGVLRTEYGDLSYRPGDYLLLPRGTTFCFAPAAATELLAVEAVGERFSLPERGPLGRHAFLDPAMVEVPEPSVVESAPGEEHVVVVKRGGEETRVTYGFHPFDVVGWKGDLAPMRVNVDDLRPVVSAGYHLPPSVHSTFVAPGFVVCTFVPRPVESDPDAVRLPFFHRNSDYDEVLFYHRGTFSSRAGIDAGMLTFHPAGLHHGPQPAARERDAAAGAVEGRWHDEVAVMVDARRPLTPTAAGAALELPGYVDSWIPVGDP